MRTDNPMTSLGERLRGPSGDRGQPGNGVAKLVRSLRGDLTTIQAKRGNVRETRRVSTRRDLWSVAVVHSNREDRYSPDAARDLANKLLAAALECKAWAREDRD